MKCNDLSFILAPNEQSHQQAYTCQFFIAIYLSLSSVSV